MINKIEQIYTRYSESFKQRRHLQRRIRLAEAQTPEIDDATDGLGFAKLFNLSNGAIAYLWIALEAGCSVIILGENEGMNMHALSFLSYFIQDIENISYVQQSPKKALPTYALFNSASFYHSKSNHRLKSDKIFDAIQTSGHIILDEVMKYEANALFLGSRNHIPFITTLKGNGYSSLVKRLTKQMNLKHNYLNRLDLSVHLFSTQQRNSCNVMEYQWLSRAEIMQGERLSNGDSVRIFDAVTNGVLDCNARGSKAIRYYAKINGLSSDDAIKELVNRSNFIGKLQRCSISEFIDSIREYHPIC